MGVGTPTPHPPILYIFYLSLGVCVRGTNNNNITIILTPLQIIYHNLPIKNAHKLCPNLEHSLCAIISALLFVVGELFLHLCFTRQEFT